MAFWFYGLSQLKGDPDFVSHGDNVVAINDENVNVSNVTTMESIFEGCSSLEGIGIGFTGHTPAFDSLTNISNAFKDCTSCQFLQLALPHIDNLIETDMFSGCHMLYVFSVDSLFRFSDDCGFDFTSTATQTGGTQWVAAQDMKSSLEQTLPYWYEMGSEATSNTFNNYLANSEFVSTTHAAMFLNGYFGPLATYDNRYNELTFTYGNAAYYLSAVFDPAHDHYTVFPITGTYTQQNLPEWCKGEYPSNITTVKIESELTSFQPESMAYWCYGLNNVSSVTIDFDGEVPDSGFDTSKVESMQSMFENCSSLKSLDFSGWDTSHVINMSSMVAGCTSLDSLDLSPLETNSLQNMDNMFRGDTNITSLNLSSFAANTTDPTTGTTHSVSMNNAFMGLDNLATFTISTAFNFTDNSGFDFGASKSWDGNIQGTWEDLSGATTYTAWNDFINNPQAQYGTVVYFTTNDGGSPIGAYMDFEGNALYVRYGLINTADTNEMAIADSYDEGNLPAWVTQHANEITRVVFTENVKENDYKPSSIAYWFSGLTSLKSIYNMFYLHTENITSLDSLFSGDTALETLDFSKVNFPAAATMKDAFKGTNALSTFITNNKFAFTDDCAFPFAGQANKFWALNKTTKMSDSVELWNNTIKSSSAQKLTFALASVTLSFDANGGSFDGQKSYNVYGNEGEDVPNIPTPSYTGHEFVGWMDKDQKKVSIPSVFPAQNATYTASWKINQYTVSFDSLGGSAVEPQTVNYGELVSKPQDPVKDGYTFSGWYKDQAHTQVWNFDTDTVASDITLYASWDEIPAPVVQGGWYEDAGGWYFINADGVRLVSEWAYLSASPKAEGWYCFDANGYLRVGGWIENASGTWSYVDETGRAYTDGWYLIGAFWYDFDENGVMLTGWIWDPSYNSWFYCDSAGHMIQGCWYIIGNTWYGFWANGTMCVGWIWDNSYGNWFYCDPYTGAMYQGCWAWIGNAWYGFWANGEMCYGWILDAGTWYYCDWWSGYMYTGWNWIGNNCYYFYNNGAMAYSTYIDGYWLNASGAWA